MAGGSRCKTVFNDALFFRAFFLRQQRIDTAFKPAKARLYKGSTAAKRPFVRQNAD